MYVGLYNMMLPKLCMRYTTLCVKTGSAGSCNSPTRLSAIFVSKESYNRLIKLISDFHLKSLNCVNTKIG